MQPLPVLTCYTCALASAKIPSLMEPTGIAHSNGKQFEMPRVQISLLHPIWLLQPERQVWWLARLRKLKLSSMPFSAPVTISSWWPSSPQNQLGLRPFPSSWSWGAGSGQRLAVEPRSLQFLLQGLSVAIQRGNAVAVMGTLPSFDMVFISL